MEESEIKAEVDVSVSSKLEKVSNSKVKTQKSDFGETKRYENTVGHLNKVISK
jgi:hypothetical protein